MRAGFRHVQKQGRTRLSNEPYSPAFQFHGIGPATQIAHQHTLLGRPAARSLKARMYLCLFAGDEYHTLDAHSEGHTVTKQSQVDNRTSTGQASSINGTLEGYVAHAGSEEHDDGADL